MLNQKALEKIIKDKLKQSLKQCGFKQAIFSDKDYTAVRISVFSKVLAKEICDKQGMVRRAEKVTKN